MSRFGSRLPWGLLFHVVMLLVIAWWIEDCLIYYIPWSEIGTIRTISGFAALTHIGDFFRFFFKFIADIGRGLALAAGKVCTLIQTSFDALPEHLRARAPMRLVAWMGATLVATFGAGPAADFWDGLGWAVGKLFKALLALNGGFWLHNSLRRLGQRLESIITYPVRFYSERNEEEPEAEMPADDPNELAGRKRGDGRTRRREYVQFMQGHVERIGIILAGGGAQGAYQAGALKAIHEFLRDYNAVHKVKMIAGTSIGAWNAMFWLAGLVDSRSRSGLEGWWKNLNYRRQVEFPWLYIPFFSSSILRSKPWRESFQSIFGGRLDEVFGDNAPTHFYFTRADVSEAALRYSTNWTGIGDRLDKLGKDKDDDYRLYDVIEAGDDAPAQTADAIFASMNLPPLFPGAMIDGSMIEDGGAIDDLPLRFGSPIEDCDLIFVLPLHTTYQQYDGKSSNLLGRVLRVADLRRGVIGSRALRGADTINRFAQRVERLEFGVNTMANAMPPEGVAAEALSGVREEITEFNAEHKLLYLFTVCPSGKLELGTFNFWNRRGIQDAFDLMYLQTRRELANRLFEDIEPEDPHVVFIDGEIPDINALPKPTHKRPSDL